MTIIVGLGNPGTKYVATRHNIGYAVVDRLANELGSTPATFNPDKSKLNMIAKVGGVLLVKPQTYMNDSGRAIRNLVDYYKSSLDAVWVIHDDIDLPLGKIRIREKGGSGGHKGVASMIDHLGSDAFIRFRLGVGRGKAAYKDIKGKKIHRSSVISHVLSRFGRSEAGKLKQMIKHGTNAVRLALLKGVDKAMNRYN